MTGDKSIVFKFADAEVREREFSLVKAGEVLPVEPKTFRVLLYLLRNPQKLIAKEELLNAVWGDAAVTDSSLTRTIAQLRRLLGDDIRDPRYIETVATVGYRFLHKVEISEGALGCFVTTNSSNGPSEGGSAPPSPHGDVAESAAKCSTQFDKIASEHEQDGRQIARRRYMSKRWLLPGAALLALSLAVAVWYLFRPLPPPRVTDYIQITHDGRGKFLVGTDGSRLYFNRDDDPQPAQIAIAGGQSAPLPVALPGRELADVSPDGSSFLVFSEEKGQRSLWDVQVPGGSVRRLVNGTITSAAWSPDGKSVVYSTPDDEIYVARRDGTEARKLVDSEHRIGSWAPSNNLVWSPNGGNIRFTRDFRIWEVSSDGSGLHELLPGWHPSSRLCCGRWTPDGKSFLFVDRTFPAPGYRAGRLWALDERRALLRRSALEPTPLTSGPIQWATPILGRDGKKIFARGLILRGELVRYDASSRELRPWLGGMSVEHLSYSPDGKSVVYVSFPEGILWRAKLDGTNAVQLTGPPFYPFNPRWSPDGSKILFYDDHSGGLPQCYIVSSQGGTPQLVLLGDTETPNEPNWSPDGQKIVFGSGSWQRWSSDKVLRVLDLASNQTVTVPGSQGLWSPRWSPNGRFIVGINRSGGCSIFAFDTKRWVELQKGVCNWPTWSSDSQFIYLVGGWRDDPGVYRVRVSDRHADLVVDLKGFRPTGAAGFWMGLDPTDTPMLIRDTGSDDIYSLPLEEK